VAAGPITEQEARRAFGAARSDAQPARPTSFILYFLEARDEADPGLAGSSSAAIIDEIARRPHRRSWSSATPTGSARVPYNDTLSLRRAERVRDELVKVLASRPERIRVAGAGARAAGGDAG